MSETTELNRFSRYSGILSPEDIQRIEVCIVGCGAIGRQVAAALASMGVEKFILIDPDQVGPENLGSQGWWECDEDADKVEALEADLVAINSSITTTVWVDRFELIRQELFRTPKPLTGPCSLRIMVSTVDSMEARDHIWDFVQSEGGFNLFMDARMAAEYCEIYTIDPSDSDACAFYEGTLFADAEAFQDGCTTKATIYCAGIAAGWLVARISHSLRNFDVPYLTTVNILAGRMSTADTALTETE